MLNEKYAGIFMEIARDYAGRQSTDCAIAESIFEKELLFLFSLAKTEGVSLQDIVVITSTALAVLLTKPQDSVDERNEPKTRVLELV